MNNEGLTQKGNIADVAEPSHDGAVIDRAVAVLETGERVGVLVRLADVAIHFGFQEPNRVQRAGDALKRLAPERLKERGHVLTRDEKIGRVAVAMEGCRLDRPSATERFGRDKRFWELMGVDDAWDAFVFDREHFDRTELDLHSDELSDEVAWLRAADSETFADLRQLQNSGRGLRLRELTKTPDVVLDSANRVAEDTQKTFMHTWLPAYLHDGQKPIITEAEHEQCDYDGELQVIDAFRQRALGIEVDGELDEQEQATIEKANQLLSEGLAGEYVLRRLLHDHTKRESESLRQMLPVLAMLSGAAWATQQYAPNDALRACAKIAGSGDDILTEVMSLGQLKLSKGELRKRLSWFVPLAIGMVAADYFVDDVDRLVNPYVGGFDYGFTTVVGSAGSSIGSYVKHRSRFEELVAENKVREEDLTGPGRAARQHYIYNDPVRKGIVAGIIGGPLINSALWPWIADKPYIYVPLGAIEPVAAFVSTKYDELRLPRQLKKYARQQTAGLVLKDRPGSGSIIRRYSPS